MYVGLSPAVREVFNAHSRGEKKDMAPMKHYLNTLSLIHHDAMWWFHEIVPGQYSPNAQLFSKCIYKGWLPDGYSQILDLNVFGPSGLKDYRPTTLRCKI